MKPTPDKLIELGRELFRLAGREKHAEYDELCESMGRIAWKLCERLREEMML